MITWLAFIVYSLYEAVAVPLYIRIIYVLITQSEFAKVPFYRLIAVNGILDVSMSVIFQLFYQLPLFPPTMGLFPKEPSRLITIPIVVNFSLIYQIFFMHSAIALNRASAILWPLSHKRFWKRWWPAFPAAGVALSLLFTFHRMASVGQFGAVTVTEEADCGYTPYPVIYDLYSVNQNVLTASLGAVNLLVCMFFNLMTFCKILKRRRDLRRQNQQQSQQQEGFNSEVRLFIITVWMMVFMSILNAFEVLLAVGSGWIIMLTGSSKDALTCFVLSQNLWVAALFTLSQPWVLLLANRRVRLAAFPFLKKFGLSKIMTLAQTTTGPVVAVPNERW